MPSVFVLKTEPSDTPTHLPSSPRGPIPSCQMTDLSTLRLNSSSCLQFLLLLLLLLRRWADYSSTVDETEPALRKPFGLSRGNRVGTGTPSLSCP